MSKNKPDNIIEIHCEAVSIFMNEDVMAVLTHEPVGGTDMYVVQRCIRSNGDVRDPATAPAELEPRGAYVYYGKALQVARKLVGYDWEPHPLKPKDLP